MFTDLSDFSASVADQDRGRWLDIPSPIDGTPTGLKFLIAGPDSATQHRAKIAMMDELADMARLDGTVPAESREAARLNCLARCVLDFEVVERGERLGFNHQMVVRMLRTGMWIQTQIDAFAADRSNFRPL